MTPPARPGLTDLTAPRPVFVNAIQYVTGSTAPANVQSGGKEYTVTRHVASTNGDQAVRCCASVKTTPSVLASLEFASAALVGPESTVNFHVTMDGTVGIALVGVLVREVPSVTSVMALAFVLQVQWVPFAA